MSIIKESGKQINYSVFR